ncbi:hypothetical protein RPE78_00210 [Thioclava litoralis]|uniref:Muramidase (Phage lambda lysozyme) n=1 Tax=Thioclava litoralis TaxID=3076557 RepID=A0ABZ1DYA6_9RHOB|nr:hypothetical protein RPE78_00210 [Thioclava sp. FTW29]
MRQNGPLPIVLSLLLAAGGAASSATAQPVSLLAAQGAFVERSQALIPALQTRKQAAQPLVQLASLPREDSAPAPTGASSSGSLFTGAQGSSFFAPSPARPRALSPRGLSPQALPDPMAPITSMAPFLRQGSSEAEWIRHLIAQAEAGPMGYDAVQYGAKRRPARVPSQMTLGEIYAWIEATPGQPHAIGRYQFIPTTLRRLAASLQLGPEVRFSPNVQDRLADLLLEEAGLSQLLAGDLTRRRFMNNLAKIWAGLPTSNGQSHYDGYAGNKATMSWAKFDREMARIFPG